MVCAQLDSICSPLSNPPFGYHPNWSPLQLFVMKFVTNVLFVCVVLPIILLATVIATSLIQNDFLLRVISLTFLYTSLHSPLNSLVVIFASKTYRHTLRRFLLSFVRKTYHSSTVTIEGVN
ncbi:unnamed protein product, partial [Mesorhabditis belari]